MNYVTIWEPEWMNYQDSVLQSLQLLVNTSINTVVIDIRWQNYEKTENVFDFTQLHYMCTTITSMGFQIMPLISIYYCPQWIFGKSESAFELDEYQVQVAPKNPSMTDPVVRTYAKLFMSKVLNELDSYRQNIISISVSWNNEHETKFTQTHDHFRSYEQSTQIAFRQFLSSINNNINHWNVRWNTNFTSFDDVNIPVVNGRQNNNQITQFYSAGQIYMDLFEFRRTVLIDVYKDCCDLIKTNNFSTWLHFGEIFTCVDAIYQGDIIYRMITESWLDIIAIDSNLSRIGIDTNDPFIAYIICTACKMYEKQVIFEMAFERDRGDDAYLQAIQYALNANVDGIGYTNFLNYTDISQYLNLKRVRWGHQVDILIVYPITGCLVLRQRQDIVGGEIDPVQEIILKEAKYWYSLGFQIDVIGDPLYLENINLAKYHTVVYLEPLAILSAELTSVYAFFRTIPRNIDVIIRRLDNNLFTHQNGYVNNILRFYSISENVYNEESSIEKIRQFSKQTMLTHDQGGSLELGKSKNNASPYIDFHTNTYNDFDVRMVANNSIENYNLFIFGNEKLVNLKTSGDVKTSTTSLNNVEHRLKILESYCKIDSTGAVNGELLRWSSEKQKWCVPQVNYEPSVNGEPNFIIALTGQSNSQGAGGFYDPNNIQDQPHERIKAWNQGYTGYASGYPWYTEGGYVGWETADLRNTIGTKMHNFQCLAFHFAKRLVETYNDIVVGIINCGFGGQPIARWAIFETNEQWYNYNVSRYQNQGDIFTVHSAMMSNALSQLQAKNNVDVVLWHQGESDGDLLIHGQSDTDPDYYKKALEHVIYQYRNLPSMTSKTPFIVGETTGGDWNGTDVGWEARNIQLRQLNNDADPYTRCVLTSDLTFGTEEGFDDPIHFSSVSHRVIGQMCLLEYKKML